ncbi:MAG: bifunctional [glutamate--ammonia ligase]-adenylyl-L-tyrosine phosphorylase/[glutamate--ammonia-ligase] adenylyltransferase [Pseudomonadota bacterium]
MSRSGELLDARLAQVQELAPQTWQRVAADARLQAQCQAVLLGSDFVQRSLIQDDQLLAALVDAARLQQPTGLPEYIALLDAVATQCGLDETRYANALRALRRREMVRIAWRDISGMASLHATLRETSWLAEAVIAGATRFSEQCLVQRHGALPAQNSGLVVLGMGKLGGGELNFSSDVDLVFLFPEGGMTTGAAPVELEEFYTRQGRMLIRLLDAVTDTGFVFRVDMRLRPFGDSGPLVASFAFFEDYLQAHGRDWERYAYIKARAVSGAEAFAAERESVLRPFVYRRYLDFGVFDALREMKGLISRDVARREMADNIKLGPGGIREIEFIVQAFQLVRGGQDGALRAPSLLTVLPRLSGAKLLPADAVAELGAAYDFLRQLENRTQMLGDQQTHTLPDDAQSRQRIALSMGFATVPEMEQEFARHRAIVAGHFAGLFADGDNNGRQARKLDLAALWEPALGEAATGEAALDNGVMRQQLDALCDDAPKMIEQLVALRDSGRMRRMDEPGRKRLKLLLELLIGEHGVGRHPETWRRLVTVIEAIGQRSAYFSLLVENRKARERWVAICSEGDFLAAQLARNPALLDELIDERWLEALPSRAELQEELVHRLSDVAADDTEREVEALCRFKQAAVFRVALADLSGRLPLMSVSDRLTEIAELIVARTLDLAWRQMIDQFGAPGCEVDGKRRKVRVAALGYGKLGGFELGYASDLDLVFLHDSTGEGQETDRAAPVDNQVFFLRFAQRLIHLLTMHSGAGRLYEVDVRLRPSGKGGFLVTSIEAFRRYQFEEAWTWEHQALLHARAVAGNAGLMTRIEAVRIDVLRNAVRRDDLRERVAEMRERMRRELSAAQPGEFDLKQDRGGIADIEFLAQYWALRWAKEFPPLVHFSDTIRQLESVASAALVPQEQVDQLVQAYQMYRALSHRRSLEGLSGAVAAGDLLAQRGAVTAIWSTWMSQPV